MSHTELPLFSCQLQHQTTLIDNIIEIILSKPEGFTWQVGDYLWFGSEQTEFKPFSIANLPSDKFIKLQISVVPVIAKWLTHCFSINSLQIKGPVSQYNWVNNNKPIIMLAGGTGITPLLTLLQGHQANLAQQKVALYWGVRHSELLFAQETLDTLASSYSNFTWFPIVSEPNLHWKGLTGLLPDVLAQESVRLTACNLMICGPWPMVKALKQLALDQGVASENIQ